MCGDVNNGFGFQINWNELGDGPHSISVRADGNVFAQMMFTVQTLGVPFLSGAAGNYQLQGFAGKNIQLQWSEPLQNFVITGWTPSSTPPPPPPSGNFSGQYFFQANLIQNTCGKTCAGKQRGGKRATSGCDMTRGGFGVE